MILLKMPLIKYCDMLKNVMKNSLIMFKGPGYEPLYSIAVDLNKSGNKFLPFADEYLNLKKEKESLTQISKKKRVKTKKALKKMVTAVDYVYGDESKSVLLKVGIKSLSARMSQIEFNQFIRYVLDKSRIEFADHDSIMQRFSTFELVANDYLENDDEHEELRRQLKSMKIDKDNMKLECDNQIKTLAVSMKYKFGDDVNDKYIQLGLILINKKSKRDVEKIN